MAAFPTLVVVILVSSSIWNPISSNDITSEDKGVKEEERGGWGQGIETPDAPVSTVTCGRKTFYIERFFKATWHRALQFCKFHGMELASIKNVEENDRLADEIQKLHDIDHEKYQLYFTSGNNFSNHSRFIWAADGESVLYKGFLEIILGNLTGPGVIGVGSNWIFRFIPNFNQQPRPFICQTSAKN